MLNIMQNKRFWPPFWERQSYKGVTHVVNYVPEDSDEYYTCFDRWGFTESDDYYDLYRIQHPFAYGRFLLYKQQMELGSRKIQVTEMFFKTNADNMIPLIENNLDLRILGETHDEPDFCDFIDNCLPINEEEVVFVVKYCHHAESTNKMYYPEYVMDNQTEESDDDEDDSSYEDDLSTAFGRFRI